MKALIILFLSSVALVVQAMPQPTEPEVSERQIEICHALLKEYPKATEVNCTTVVVDLTSNRPVPEDAAAKLHSQETRDRLQDAVLVLQAGMGVPDGADESDVVTLEDIEQAVGDLTYFTWLREQVEGNQK